MPDTNEIDPSLALIAGLAEELAFALSAELLAEDYKQPSAALTYLAQAKALLDQRGHPVGPMLAETLEIAMAQGGLLPRGATP
ncbi:hypothetical protein [Methylobacterium sp. WSM2598]|uniref:hypothetical protein n=1 Tax=Methylobacterium sp. WSM2598 TaxID=398261 RepID=UPI00037C6883|nr:hypothetical protein [Methylobacterium sp. WSM2598]